MNEMTPRLEGLLASGKDSALMRCTLGKAYLDGDAPAVAHSHLQRATELDPGYSVAWKLLGRALLALDDASGARQAWSTGLACAQDKGDAQVVKEIGVFLKRLDRQQAA